MQIKESRKFKEIKEFREFKGDLRAEGQTKFNFYLI